jgi:branched-chain amino acid transport system ATP-binding protein
MADALLTLRDVRAGYGDAVVLDGVSLEVPEGGSLALLGRNGVGKTTLLLTIMGFTRVTRGSVEWSGRDITRVPPHKRAGLGIGWVPQERDIFPSLSVEENLTVAARPGRWDLDSVYGLFPRLAERRNNRGNHLSGGEQQMLSIARAMIGSPKLIMLDEPSEGIMPVLVDEMFELFRSLKAEGMTILLVEQNVELALGLADRVYVVDHGAVVHSGAAGALLADPEIQERYCAV